MSKKKKGGSESKFLPKTKLKGVKKNKKNNKIKHKEFINHKVKSKSKPKINVQNNVAFKSKNKTLKQENESKLKSQEHNKVNSTKKNKLLKKLNVNKLSAMLNTKEKQITKKDVKNNTPLSLRERMLAQLRASRFRFLNEQMYSKESSETKKYFQDDPQAFYAYHEGYKHQVERWPVNPVDIIIESIKKMPNNYIVVDFGCGEAKLADSVPQTVHSFDLIAVNEKVQACDMSNTPLLTGRANVVVFCLSLMGSNLRDYLLEANRVLDKNGILKIAEVESRFNKVDDFIKTLKQYGFENTWKDLSNNLFYFMDFKKIRDVLKKDGNKLPALTLKPCLYKKR